MNADLRIAELEAQLQATRCELEEARAEAAKGRFFRKLVEGSPDGISVVSAEGRIVYMSPSYDDLFAEGSATRVGEMAGSRIHPDEREAAHTRMRALMARGAGATERVELRQQVAGGQYVSIEATSRNLLEDPDVHGLAAYVRDVSGPVRLREELQRAYAFQEQALRAAGESLCELDLSTYELATPSHQAPGTDLLDEPQRGSDVVYGDDRDALRSAIEGHLDDGLPIEVDVRMRKEAREPRWYRIAGGVVRDENGAPVRLIGRRTDIHERKVAQIALDDSERTFRALFESAGVAVTIRDFDTLRLIDCNPAALRLFASATREQLASIPLERLSAPYQLDGRAAADVLREWFGRGERRFTDRGEWLLRRVDGKIVHADLRTTVITLASGQRLLHTIYEDVTERIEADKALRDGAARDALVSRISRRFVESDLETALPVALESLGKFFGAGRVRLRRFRDGGATLITQKEWCAPGVPPSLTTRDAGTAALARWILRHVGETGCMAIEDAEALPPDDHALMVTPEQREARAFVVAPLSNHGEITGWITLAHIGAPHAWTEHEIGVARLVAEIVSMGCARAEAEDQMRASEERYRSLVERSRDGILALDLESRVLFASPSVLDLSGYTPEEWLATPNLLFDAMLPESLPNVLAAREAILRTRDVPSMSFDTAWRRKDGAIVYANSVLVGIRDEDGELVGVQIISRDITERRQAEEARRKRARHDEILSDVSRRFLNDDPEIAIDATLSRIGEAFDAERVSIFVPDDRGERLRCTHRWLARGADDPFEALDAFPVPQGAFDVQTAMDSWLSVLQRESGKRILYAPVGYGGRLSGLLTIRAREGRAFGEDDVATLRSIAELIAIGRVRRAAELALAKAKEDAEGATRTKSAFLANMSHELRTPLNGVIGMVDLLSKTSLDERQRHYTVVARSSAGLLLSVINDILDFSKLEVGKLEIESIEFTFQEIVEEVSSILALSAEEKGLELSCQSSSGLATRLLGDPARLRQILVNLVSNAIKFTPAGEVSLRATIVAESDAQTRARVEVKDTGIGIPLEAQARLFVPFTQVDASTTRVHGGTGLGLAICRELVERMGGTIGVVSSPGAGSSFWFEVPVAKPSTAAASEPNRDQRLVGVHVLAVDDNATNRELLESQLAGAGMRCETAADGATAFAMLVAACSRDPYAIALLDHHMPGIDGRELARRIGGEPRLGATRVVMLGSVARPLPLDEQRALRIVGYCTKPIWRKQLLGVLVAALEAVPTEGVRDEAARAMGSTGAARILLVEDSPINAEVAGEILRSAGYEIDLAEDGAAAVRAAAARSYALVLMDCQLPEMDGYEATRRIRALPGRGDVPIVALTASVTTEDLERCFQSGMDDHISKPVDARRLVEVIAVHLAGKRLRAGTEAKATSDGTVANLARALDRLNGDRALLKRIVKQFAEGAQEQRSKLRGAVERRDGATVAFEAHRLGGQAASFDGMELVAALRGLENAAQRRNWSAAGAALLGVEEALDWLLRVVTATEPS